MLAFLIKTLALGFHLLPASWAPRVGRGLGWVFGSVFRYHRRWAEEALRLCFPEQTEGWRARVLRENYAHIGQLLVESLRLMYLTPTEVLAQASWEGREHLEEALRRGRGVLVLTAHAGNWEVLAQLLPAEGRTLAIISKEFKPPSLNRFLVRIRSRLGLHILPPHNSYRTCLKLLKQNGILGFILDQNMIRTEGVFVRFFGRWACTTPGLAHMAASSGAPVVPLFIRREASGHHVVRVLPVMEPPTDRAPETLRAATQAYTTVIEQHVRTCPEQWMWIHRRWRTQPRPEEQPAGG